MTRFEDELRLGNFMCSKCTKCIHWVWPPSDFCNRCFSDVIWAQVPKHAKLVEVSRKDGTNFCIAEFENSIRVIGTIHESTSNPVPGQNLTLDHCTYDKTPRFIFR